MGYIGHCDIHWRNRSCWACNVVSVALRKLSKTCRTWLIAPDSGFSRGARDRTAAGLPEMRSTHDRDRGPIVSERAISPPTRRQRSVSALILAHPTGVSRGQCCDCKKTRKDVETPGKHEGSDGSERCEGPFMLHLHHEPSQVRPGWCTVDSRGRCMRGILGHESAQPAKIERPMLRFRYNDARDDRRCRWSLFG